MKTVVAIPQTAVAADQAGTYVYVVGKDNVVQERRVRLGARREGYIAVQDGVADGDFVIVQGQQRVRPGMTVTPEKAVLPPS